MKRALLGLSTLLLSACCWPYCEPPAACALNQNDWQSIEANGQHSSARIWNELNLHAIRQVLPQPTAHSRNLFHLSSAMYDLWASTNPSAQGVFYTQKHLGLTQAELEQAIAFAAYRVLYDRYSLPSIRLCFDLGLKRANLEPSDRTDGDTPAAIGNRVANAVLEAARNDGSNQANGYADTSAYAPRNRFLIPTNIGTEMDAPDHWQPLLLEQPFTQNGIPQNGPQAFMGAHWGKVKPFAMLRNGAFYHDPGAAPSVDDPLMASRWVLEVVRKQSQLDVLDQSSIDISPATMGNNPLGSNNGTGHPLNPASNQPYATQVVKQSDFGRVLAEYWADGPRSETPPGHWNVLANQVSDDPVFVRKLGGTGQVLSKLEWDVKLYLALNGALHDAAISAWEVKRATDRARPISLVRYLANLQRLPVTPGLIEERAGMVWVRGWRASTGVQWENASGWVPYQRDNFVTPAFPGFVSGHSTFSRAAAEVLADLTGSKFFPGGLHGFLAPAGFAGIDPNSSNKALRLQWATYFDAADQAGQSRIWGGIHIEPDDLMGRRLGHEIGLDAVALARKYFAGTAR